jgi:ferredoxin-type protein NapF
MMHGGPPSTVTRRELFGRGQNISVIRPPWALPEADFVTVCDGCNKCIPKCPENIIKPTDDDLVQLSFDEAGCTFCGECVAICPTGALSKAIEPPLALEARVHGSCIALHGVMCRLCEDACETRAIRFRLGLNGKSYPIISEVNCNGCGACVSRCPSTAIHLAEVQVKEQTMGNTK